jgi:hypothetical protein
VFLRVFFDAAVQPVIVPPEGQQHAFVFFLGHGQRSPRERCAAGW